MKHFVTTLFMFYLVSSLHAQTPVTVQTSNGNITGTLESFANDTIAVDVGGNILKFSTKDVKYTIGTQPAGAPKEAHEEKGVASRTQVIDALAEKVFQESNGYIAVVSFDKKDGYPFEDKGKFYTVEGDLQVLVVDDIFKYSPMGRMDWRTFDHQRQKINDMDAMVAYFQRFSKGTILKFEIIATLQSKERGWDITKNEIKSYQYSQELAISEIIVPPISLHIVPVISEVIVPV